VKKPTLVVRSGLQDLNLMNDPALVEAWRFLAQRMMLEGGTSPKARIAPADGARVRFIQLDHRGGHQHNDLPARVRAQCFDI
jgi:hypothetical protein